MYNQKQIVRTFVNVKFIRILSYQEYIIFVDASSVPSCELISSSKLRLHSSGSTVIFTVVYRGTPAENSFIHSVLPQVSRLLSRYSRRLLYHTARYDALYVRCIVLMAEVKFIVEKIVVVVIQLSK